MCSFFYSHGRSSVIFCIKENYKLFILKGEQLSRREWGRQKNSAFANQKHGYIKGPRVPILVTRIFSTKA